MTNALVELVWLRARRRCEYCQIPSATVPLDFEIDHIIARKHRGATVSENLALACLACNHYKGPCIAGLDPVTDKLTRLFHPRRDRWSRHFVWEGAELAGRTSVGRTTVVTLEINLLQRVEFRLMLMETGLFWA